MIRNFLSTKHICSLFSKESYKLPKATFSIDEFRSKTTKETISEEEFDHLCNLSHLKIKEEDKPKLSADFSDIISCLNQISEVDTTNVEPLYNVIEDNPTLQLEIKDPELTGEPVEKIVSNAKHLEKVAPLAVDKTKVD